jgi:hypothetical protein
MPWTGGDEDVRQLVRDLATVRQAIPSLRRGSFEELQSERGLVVYDRRSGSDVAVVAINGDQQRTVDVPLAKLGLDRGVLRRTMGPGTSGEIDGANLRMTLAPRAAGIFLVGAPPAAGAAGIALAAMFLLAMALLVVLLVIAAAVAISLTLVRRLRRG